MRAGRSVRAAAHVFGISVTRRLLQGVRECQCAEQRGSQTSGVMRNTPTPVWELELDCRGNHTALKTSPFRLSIQFSVHLTFSFERHRRSLYWFNWVRCSSFEFSGTVTSGTMEPKFKQ